ncbi:NAD-dependent epimerase/dehydratase family protein [Enterocloster bolteae]|jgi:GDP-L-fucose synthase|uniref:NAD-dependent epimerase/dehydratase family protein n=1 Tax=Enterocloster bolteae TaxID=208479 RepID=A0A412YT91_9FIRM|nr:NAD-dependent epimerase/dehydratase family protein [Enterocloster bolteae]RGQ56227.1 NAD-dependent epimerase/dehydratase family protein [Enterocloster bolteae]RGS01899.1 NAD-dependent epimerase/dehydratase family protein [Enterocloster bolteae]RGV68718.1 NAD-dependent epimerase/dehydratase family protein [Enterocloster bolteae]
MNVLVTGGKGFVGTAFCNKIKENFKDISLFAPSSRELDLLDLKNVCKYLKEKEITHIIHLAAKLGGVHLVTNKPLEYLENNLIINYNIVHAAREQKIVRFITLGSSCSYSENVPLPNVETQLWQGYPENTYGICKLVLLEHLEKQNDFEWVYLIPPNIFGPGDHFGEKDAHFIPSTVKKLEDAVASNTDSIVAWGDGSQTRDFVYIDDLVYFLIEAFNNEKYNHCVLNISTGIEISIKDIVSQIMECMGLLGRINVIWDITRPVGSKRKVLSNERLLKLNPNYKFIPFSDGLQKTISEYMEGK